MKENKSLLVISGVVSGLIQVSIIIGMLVLPNITFNSTSINSFSENIFKQEYSSNDDSQYSKNYISGFFENNSQKEGN